ELAKELGVRIYTILIGRGGAVPFPAGKDIFGRVIYRNQVFDTNPELLKQIAHTTGGDAYEASDKQELDEGLGAVLDSLERSKIQATVEVNAYAELFPAFVLAALVL